MQNIFLKKLKDTKAITVLVLIKTGSRYESDTNRGVAHFLEHLLFKGTKKRPNSLAITKELDSIGAEFNAFTSKDKTGFYIKAPKEHLEKALDVLSDMLFNSLFSPREIEKERGVVLEEFNMYYDNPMMFIDSLLECGVFHGHNLGKLILGDQNVIKNIKRAEILKFYKKYYNLENLVIGVSGNFDENKLLPLVKKYFKIKEYNTTNNFDEFLGDQKQERILIKNKETDQVHTAIGFLGTSIFDKDYYSSKLLSIILGGNMSSRLFLKIREKMGLCYYIKSYTDSYQDTGIFSIISGLDKSRIESAVETILKELKSIKQNGVTEEELKRAKEFIDGKLVLNLEDSANIVEWYGDQLLLQGKAITPEEFFKHINKISIKDIKKVANRIFLKEKLNLAVIGPFKNSKEWELKFKNIINKIL